MKYLLDTNACIGLLRGRPAPLVARMRTTEFTDIALSTVVLAELLVGARKSRDPANEKRLVEAFTAPFSVLPFDMASARAYARHPC
mgnify:CR=1 FL=1